MRLSHSLEPLLGGRRLHLQVFSKIILVVPFCKTIWYSTHVFSGSNSSLPTCRGLCKLAPAGGKSCAPGTISSGRRRQAAVVCVHRDRTRCYSAAMEITSVSLQRQSLSGVLCSPGCTDSLSPVRVWFGPVL